jgi:hypothetical protein
MAPLAFAGGDDFAVLSTFEEGVEAVETQLAFLLFFAVAAEAGGFENGPDIFGVGEAFFVGCGRKFSEINCAQVEFFGVGRGRERHKADEQNSFGGHTFWFGNRFWFLWHMRRKGIKPASFLDTPIDGARAGHIVA